MSTTPAFLSSIMTVKEEWIDFNGHLNMAYYNVLFDQAIDETFIALGLGPDYLERANGTTFTAEAHVTYLRELKLGDDVQTHLQVLDYDEKRIHIFQELYHHGQGFLSATCEQMTLHVDMAVKRVSPFPEEILSNIKKMHADHKPLPRKPQVGHVISL